MLDGIKGYLRDRLSGGGESLSVVPERKDVTGYTFDPSYDSIRKTLSIYPRLAESLIGGAPAWSGEAVSLHSAFGLSTVYACNKIISESVGFLPLVMHRKLGNITQTATDHPMYSALVNAPNAEQTAQNFTELLTSHCVMQGNSFAQIIRRSGTQTAVELQPVLPGNVHIDRDQSQRLVYVIKTPNQPDQSFTVQRGKPQDILHIRGLGWDGLRGYSVIHMARQSLGTAIAQERNVAAFYANGGRVPYVLTRKDKFANDQDFMKFGAEWKAAYSEPHAVPILEDGLTYEQIGMSAKDSQLLESRQYTIPEICRWFSVSPHLVGDLSRATFSNIESLADQFVRFTLMTWLTRWRQECWRCILTPDEQAQGFYFEHDLTALLKSDFAARMAGYATQLQNGMNSINEIRAREGENPIPGGDAHYVQVNLAAVGSAAAPLSDTGRVQVIAPTK